MRQKYDLKDVYTGAVEDVLTAATASRNPLSLDILFDLASEYGVNYDSLVLDVGCANGGNSRELMARTGCKIEGVDFLLHLVAMGKAENKEAGVEGRFKIQHGSITDIPFADDYFDFVFCRDTLTLIDDLPKALAECRRVLKPDRFMLIYMTLATSRLSPEERRALNDPLSNVDNSMNERYVETCFTEEFAIVRKIVVGSQGRQYTEESGDHDTTQGLLSIARLLTWPEYFIEKYGQKTYHIALAEAHWGVYQMLGKLSPTIYVLQNNR
jgi:ubiquinone/menaquinone biosynthesis C-methylase UbiE